MEKTGTDEPPILYGGKLIAEGAYGCVYGPALKCKSKKASTKKIQKNTEIKDGDPISKLIEKEHAELEFAIAKEIQKIPLWKHYYIVPHEMCIPAPKQKELEGCDATKDASKSELRLLQGIYGGTILTNYRLNFYKDSFYDLYKYIIECTALLTLHSIIHTDIHIGNILVDSAGVPRLIDFNMALDARKDHSKDDLLIGFAIENSQLSPDRILANAVARGKDGMLAIDSIMKYKPVLKKIQAVLGVSMETMQKELIEFYDTSKAIRNKDIVGWFNNYWPQIDSWAIGIIGINLLSKLLLWPNFTKGSYATYSNKINTVLKGLVEMNPRKRIDCVQALAYLEPNNYIIVKYGKGWLDKVGRFTP
jgi:serine/threonine protein kinase